MKNGTSPRSDASGPSYQQLGLARLVADRHGLTLPDGYEDDGPWIRRFLDVFAFDPATELDVFRRVANLIQWAREGREPGEMARKLEIKANLVTFALEVLHDSGINLDEVVEDLGPDPDETYWRDAEIDAYACDERGY